jgi:hypothetical protein
MNNFIQVLNVISIVLIIIFPASIVSSQENLVSQVDNSNYHCIIFMKYLKNLRGIPMGAIGFIYISGIEGHTIKYLKYQRDSYRDKDSGKIYTFTITSDLCMVDCPYSHAEIYPALFYYKQIQKENNFKLISAYWSLSVYVDDELVKHKEISYN